MDTFNWVDDVGGLPSYIKRISDALQRKGMDESRAIATAVNTVKRWAEGGGDVHADTRAKAAAALAEWEAKKAKAHADNVTSSGAFAVVDVNGNWHHPKTGKFMDKPGELFMKLFKDSTGLDSDHAAALRGGLESLDKKLEAGDQEGAAASIALAEEYTAVFLDKLVEDLGPDMYDFHLALKDWKLNFVPSEPGDLTHVDNPAAKVDTKDWEKISGPKGSNPGGIHVDPDGVKHYVKEQKSDTHARNEVLAAKLYEKAGVNAAKVQLADTGKLTEGTAAPIIDGTLINPKDPAHLLAARKGFAIDAWLGNWDTVGLSNDNILIDKDGNAVRIDVGGSLLMRAQGTPKGQAWNDAAAEFETLRDPKKNPQAAAVFGGMSGAELKESAELLNNISDEDIDALVDSLMDGPDAATMRKRLKARKKAILSKAGVKAEPAPKTVEEEAVELVEWEKDLMLPLDEPTSGSAPTPVAEPAIPEMIHPDAGQVVKMTKTAAEIEKGDIYWKQGKTPMVVANIKTGPKWTELHDKDGNKITAFKNDTLDTKIVEVDVPLPEPTEQIVKLTVGADDVKIGDVYLKQGKTPMVIANIKDGPKWKAYYAADGTKITAIKKDSGKTIEVERSVITYPPGHAKVLAAQEEQVKTEGGAAELKTGHKVNEWTGQPRPVEPVEPEKPEAGNTPPGVFTSWLKEAEGRYSAFHPGKNLANSHNMKRFLKVMSNDESYATRKNTVDELFERKYLTPEMRDYAYKILEDAQVVPPGVQDKYDEDLADWKAAHVQWKADLQAWADGNPSAALGMNSATNRTVQWANKNLKTPSGPGAQKVESYSGSTYETVQKYLYANGVRTSGNSEYWYKDFIAGMDSQVHEFGHDAIVHRGTSSFAELGVDSYEELLARVGNGYHLNKAFASTSIGGKAEFDGKPIQMKIRISPESKGIWARPVSLHKAENEWIIARGTKYIIHAVYQCDGKTWVDIEAVPENYDLDAFVPEPREKKCSEA